MNIVRLWAYGRGWLSTMLLTLTLGLAVAMPAAAQQTAAASGYTSFVKDSYYLGHGGTPPSLAAFAANPRAYLRSEAAYQHLKNGFGAALGRSLNDQEFQTILASDQVRLRDCSGRITTAGVKGADMRWTTRSCYAGEKLIELNVNNQWVVVASQGCFNLVRPEQPVAAPAKVCRFVKTGQSEVGGQTTIVPGIHVHDAYCGHDINIAGVVVITPRGTQTSSRMVCE